MTKLILLILLWFFIVAVTGYLWGFFTTLASNDRSKHDRQR